MDRSIFLSACNGICILAFARHFKPLSGVNLLEMPGMAFVPLNGRNFRPLSGINFIVSAPERVNSAQRLGTGRMIGIAEACPPPDTGRGRGPQDTSSAIAGRSRLWEGPE